MRSLSSLSARSCASGEVFGRVHALREFRVRASQSAQLGVEARQTLARRARLREQVAEAFALALKLDLRRTSFSISSSAARASRARERVFEASHVGLGRGGQSRDAPSLFAQTVALLALGFERAQALERFEVRARVRLGRALALGGAARAASAPCKSRSLRAAESRSTSSGLRRRATRRRALGLVQFVDRERALFRLAPEARESSSNSSTRARAAARSSTAAS
jgi:hypothetical protein